MMKPHNHVEISLVNAMMQTKPRDFIGICERGYEKEIEKVVKAIKAHKNCSMILTSGPSASTKTTTSNKLAKMLKNDHIDSVVISLDNFFVNRNNLPKLSNGDTDYESVNTIDKETLRRCFYELLNEKTSDLPIFDFEQGKRSDKTNKITLSENSVVIVEGIHALNPAIVEGFDHERYLKLYISPHSDYYDGDEMVLSSRNTRLIRRLVRDYFYRANPVSSTLSMWENVVKSEVENIIPFRETADLTIDSTICYEPCLYRQYLLDVSTEKNLTDLQKQRLLTLDTALSRFFPISRELLPKDTVLWEFLR